VFYTVGVADFSVSSDPEDTLITHALGSCLGVTVYDAAAKVGGMMHVMLPSSSVDPAKARENPFMFMDTALPVLFDEAQKRGALLSRLLIRAAGGANSTIKGDDDYFQIGRRNFIMLRKILWDRGMLLHHSDVGGSGPRTVRLVIANGEMQVKINGFSRTL
jgi:chemotaxis protein CheD